MVSDFGGHSLSGFDSTSFMFNPDLPQAASLRHWYQSRGDASAISLSSAVQPTGGDPRKRKTISSIQVSQ